MREKYNHGEFVIKKGKGYSKSSGYCFCLNNININPIMTICLEYQALAIHLTETDALAGVHY